MKAIETYAIFDEDGKMSIQNSPPLKNTKVKLLILIEEEENFSKLSFEGLSKAYAANEPEYDLSLVKEPNMNYESR